MEIDIDDVPWKGPGDARPSRNGQTLLPTHPAWGIDIDAVVLRAHAWAQRPATRATGEVVENGRRYRLGVDIGGTFTDLVLLAGDGSVSTRKLPTSPDHHGRVVVDGLASLLDGLRLTPDRLAEIVHGTTVATNAVLEGKGARTGLLTTRGFRDVLEIRRIRSPELYNLQYEKPAPLVPRRHRLEVDERINHLGQVVRELDLAQAEQALRQLAEAGIESLAICFLNAYANADHEQRVGELARRVSSEWDISLSSDVLPEIREYERTSTTVINAYLKPVVRRYLQGVRDELDAAGVQAPLLIMQSNGGIMSVPAAQERPVHIIESGPAAGVIASAFLARRLGMPDVLTFDMGGTTAKASIIENGELSQTPEYEGRRRHQPDQSVDQRRRLRAAGAGHRHRRSRRRRRQHRLARPGRRPAGRAAFGRRGARSGLLPDRWDRTHRHRRQRRPGLSESGAPGGWRPAAGRDAACRALHDRVAQPLGLTLDEAAYGIHLVANSNMMRAVRAVSSQRGRDPRGYALFAFGGNGPVHAVELARALGWCACSYRWRPACSRPSACSSRMSSTTTCGRASAARSLDPLDLTQLFADLERTAVEALAAESFTTRDQILLRRQVDMRYAGQSFELTVPVADGPLDRGAIEALCEAFGQEHLRTYGHRGAADQPVDLVNVGSPRPAGPTTHGSPTTSISDKWDARHAGRRGSPTGVLWNQVRSSGRAP